MTLPTHVPAREPLSDILRIAARLGLELLAASLLVFAGIRRGVALPSRNPLSGAPSARTMPDPFRPVRATLCPGLFSTAHAGPRSYTSRARAMGVSGGVRSGNGARRPNRRSGAPSVPTTPTDGDGARRPNRRSGVPTTPDRSAYVSRDTFRARAMGVSGGVRSGYGARRPNRRSGAPSVPTTPDRSTHVSRDTFRARAMGVSGGVRSGDGAGRLRLAWRHPCGQAGRLETRYREPLPPYRHRTAAPHVSRDTFRARAMGVSGGVRSGDGPHPPGQAALAPPGPINHGNGRSFRSVPAFPTGG